MWLTAMLAIMNSGASMRQGGVTIALRDSSLASARAAPNAAAAPISIPAAADLSAQPVFICSGTEPGSEAITLPFSASVVQVKSEIVSTVTSNADLVQPPCEQVHLSSG